MKQFIVLVGLLLFFACSEKRLIVSETPLVFDFSYDIANVAISGKTNLPEGTKLGISVFKDDAMVAQNFEVFVENEEFKAYFFVHPGMIDEIEVACYNNDAWQNTKVTEQLNFIKSDAWVEDALIFDKDVSADYDQYLQGIIGVNDSYKPRRKLDGEITDVSNGDIKRLSVNIIVEKNMPDEDIEQELRHEMFRVYQQYPDVKAIAVRCYYGNSDVAVKTGYFAPFGDWTKAGEESYLAQYQVKI